MICENYINCKYKYQWNYLRLGGCNFQNYINFKIITIIHQCIYIFICFTECIYKLRENDVQYNTIVLYVVFLQRNNYFQRNLSSISWIRNDFSQAFYNSRLKKKHGIFLIQYPFKLQLT